MAGVDDLMRLLAVLPSQRGEFDTRVATRGAPGQLERRPLSVEEMLRDDPVGRKRSRDAAAQQRLIQDHLNQQYQMDRQVMPPEGLQRKWQWWFDSLKVEDPR